MDIRIVDEDGAWLVNSGSFPLVDYGRAGDQIALEPGVPTQIKYSDFLKGQPTVVVVDSPVAPKAAKK